MLFDPATKTCELAATFKRKIDTKDVNGQDYIMRDGEMLDAIWAWGFIYSNSPNGHTPSTSRRGSFRMKLSSLKSDSYYNLGMSVIMSIFITISMFAALF